MSDVIEHWIKNHLVLFNVWCLSG